MRNNLDLAIALLGDLDRLAKVAGAALNLDAVVKELLESLDVEDLVVDGLRAVDDELTPPLAPTSAIAVAHVAGAHTFLVTFCPFFAPAAEVRFYMFRYLSLLFCARERLCSAQRTAKPCTYGCGSHFV